MPETREINDAGIRIMETIRPCMTDEIGPIVEMKVGIRIIDPIEPVSNLPMLLTAGKETAIGAYYPNMNPPNAAKVAQKTYAGGQEILGMIHRSFARVLMVCCL